MNKKPQALREGVEQHLGQFQLDETQLQHLLQLQQHAEKAEALPPPSTLKQRPSRQYALLSSVAALLLVVVIGWQPNQFFTNNSDLSLAIANEVAKNHIKLKPLEVSTDSLPKIRDYFTELEFSPVKSRWYQRRATKLLGARYCSIAGITAAQIRYQDKNGQLQTLYEVSYDSDIHGDIPNIDKGETPIEIIVKGVKTEIWVEQGLLMATAQEQP